MAAATATQPYHVLSSGSADWTRVLMKVGRTAVLVCRMCDSGERSVGVYSRHLAARSAPEEET